MRFLPVLLLYLFFFSFQLFSQERGCPAIRNYTPKDYDNMPQVFSVVQDKRGITYFGLNGLVMQYDGKTWTTTPNANKSSVYSLAIDKEGTVFVGATGDFGYLKKNLQGKFIFESLSYLLPKDFKFSSTWQTIVLGNDIYFRTFEAIFKYTPNPKPILQLFKAEGDATFKGIIADTVQQKMYAFHTKKGLVEIGKDSVQTVPYGDFFIDKEFYDGVQYDKDKLLIATKSNGLYLFSTNFSQPATSFEIENKSYFENNSVYFLELLPQNRIGIGSIRKGVLVIDREGKTVQELSENTLLKNNYIRSIYVDKDNYIWLGLNQGIAKIDGHFDLTYWNKEVGIKDIVETIYRYDSLLYVGTHQATYVLNGTEITQIQGLGSGQTWCFLEFKVNNEKQLLAATATGIYAIKNFKATLLTPKSSGANRLYQSAIYPNRVYSTDSRKFISLRYENGKWIAEGVWFDYKEDVRAIVETEDGTLWLGTFRGGVVRVIPNHQDVTKPKFVKLYQKEAGLPSLKDVMPFKFRDKILFGTEYGLYIFNNKTEKFEKYCELAELLCNGKQDVYAFKAMPDGKIWILPQENKRANIGYLNPISNGQYEWVYKPFRRIPQMLFRAFYAENNGVTWFGGSEGLYRYDNQRDIRNYSKQYNTLIRKVILNEDSVIYHGSLTEAKDFITQDIDYEYNGISFNFAAPSQEDETQTYYSHILEGFDKHWSEWTKESSKEYTNLKEGQYTFKVKAKNIYDVESEVASYTFSILPPWYRTWWAYILYLTFSIATIWAVVKWNTRRLEREKEKLEDIVRMRTEEILQQKEEITQQAEVLMAANTDISHKNQELNQQKEEIETQAENLRLANMSIQEAYREIQLLNEIGQHITTVLDFKLLVSTIHENVNAMMPAESFGIGIYNKAGNCLDFNGSIEKGKLLPYHFENLDNPKSLAAYCFNNIKPVLINHVAQEISKFVDIVIPEVMIGDLPQSLIYVPLLFENKPIGVITAQSFNKSAYNERDITLLATLAAYIAIAFDNAQAYKQIKIKNEQITDSIRYAQTIQNAILPNHRQLDRLFKNYFIISYPKDIVSGDFYWCSQVKNNDCDFTFLAVVDCTGHGVPGALMSMIGNTLLNELINQKGIHEPKLILENLDAAIREYLKQEENENTDGMDICLCRITQVNENQEVVYAGAKRPLFVMQQGVFKEIKGVRQSIGGVYEKLKSFEQTEITLSEGDSIYLCSDGLIDQNNYQRERYSTSRFTKLLQACANLSCEEQKQKIEADFHKFKGNADQRDDVTLVGIKF